MPRFELQLVHGDTAVERVAIVDAEGADSAADRAQALGWMVQSMRMVGAGYKAPEGAIEMTAAAGHAPPTTPAAVESENDHAWATLAHAGLIMGVCGFVFPPFAAMGLTAGAVAAGLTGGRLGRQAVAVSSAAVVLSTIGMLIMFLAVVAGGR